MSGENIQLTSFTDNIVAPTDDQGHPLAGVSTGSDTPGRRTGTVRFQNSFERVLADQWRDAPEGWKDEPTPEQNAPVPQQDKPVPVQDPQENSATNFMKNIYEKMRYVSEQETAEEIRKELETSENLDQELVLLLTQFAILGELNETNRHLRQSSMSIEDQENSRETSEMKQHISALTFEIITTSSIVAIFLASLDAALLSYANDKLSEVSGSNQNLSGSIQVVTSCWVISLLLSLAVVFVDSVSAFFHLWETIIQHGSKIDMKLPSAFGEFDKTKKPSLRPQTVTDRPVIPEHDTERTESVNDMDQYNILSRTDIQVALTLSPAFFNILLIVALTATFIGIVIHTWNLEAASVAISASTCAGIVAVAVLGSLIILSVLAIKQRKGIAEIHKSWVRVGGIMWRERMARHNDLDTTRKDEALKLHHRSFFNPSPPDNYFELQAARIRAKSRYRARLPGLK